MIPWAGNISTLSQLPGVATPNFDLACQMGPSEPVSPSSRSTGIYPGSIPVVPRPQPDQITVPATQPQFPSPVPPDLGSRLPTTARPSMSPNSTPARRVASPHPSPHPLPIWRPGSLICYSILGSGNARGRSWGRDPTGSVVGRAETRRECNGFVWGEYTQISVN